MRDLLRFLKAWRAAALAEDTKAFPWIKAHGLCSCAIDYQTVHRGNRAVQQLAKRLRNEFNGEPYPFDAPGESTYFAEGAARTQHKNERRLAWVDKTIAELSAQVKGR